MSNAIQPLRTAADYERALAETERLLGADLGSPERDRLEVLAVLVADYERRTLGGPAPTPLSALRLDMELHGRRQADLAEVLGSRSRASEILAGRRALTPTMADQIAKAWAIPRALLGPQGDRGGARFAATAAGVIGALALGMMGVGGGYYAWATHDLPSIEPLRMATTDPSFLKLDDVPLHVRQAFLAAEDSGFYQHDGSSLRGIARASLENVGNVFSGERPSGGSTITEQLVKNTLLRDEGRTLERRIRQFALASRLDATMSKDQIFEAYLNRIYFGNGVIGLAAAAVQYFGVKPADLSVSQGALLAAMAAAPNAIRIDREVNITRARERRDWVLARMSEEAFITPAVYAVASADPLRGR